MVSINLIDDPIQPRALGIRTASRPTRLRLPDLLRASDRTADHVLRGRHDYLLPPAGLPLDDRWFTRLDGDDDIEIWLISWVPGCATELHDHGGSVGALTLLSGSLDETRWEGQQLRRRRLDAGDQAGFPMGWIHDMVWAPSSIPAEPTVSVHAYSPPLTVMSYYEITGRNTLRRQRTELTPQPETR